MKESALHQLPLSTRSRQALLRSGVNSLKQLAALSQADLQSIRNIGKKSIDEIMSLQHKFANLVNQDSNPLHAAISSTPTHVSAWQLTESEAEMYSRYFAEYNSCSANALRLDSNTISMLSQRLVKPNPRVLCLTISELSSLLHSSSLDAATFGDTYKAINAFFTEYDVFPNTIGLMLGVSLGSTKTREQMGKLIHAIHGPKKALIVSMRLEGKTLHEISVEVGLTRERVRQIVSKFGPESKQTIDWIVDKRNVAKNAASVGAKVAVTAAIRHQISQLIARHGAVLPSELAQEFGTEERAAQELLPIEFRKLIINESTLVDYQPEWSRELIVLSIKKAATYYFPLSPGQYKYLVSIGEIRGPSSARVYARFGTWTELCVEAGVEPALPSRENHERLWTGSEMLSFVRRYLLEEGTSGTFEDYSDWSVQQIERIPSVPTLQKEFGNWTNAKNRALREIRKLKQKEPTDEL